ncbi:serine/threonine-protein phosphatase 6 regulatory subunit 3 isoform X2 [Episyrphus balteatus]|uniref:serine/threonine-protein phosphatase 6 regulatory subunit 3 isoform X2 n=1 Tax=Episyrphus balteatus TaxID=286459 RepID=UPI002486350F|nr:serine/threonine-protein phosphatase 6 regulatory subunit 3 isoform X2 [Episyrphus balteatus]
MFWDKGYTPSQNIEALLKKENVTVEEFLDEDDILQECKSQKNIINYFTRPDVIKRLVELITTEPSEDLPLAQRFRHANMACEVLTLGLPSLNAKLLSDNDILHTLYSYLENKPPLNPLLSSFFSKTFSMLFTKNFYQDWFLYQKMCLQLIEYIKSQGNFLELIFRHFATPVIPDLLMQMLNDVEGGALKKNLYEWLTEERLVERLIATLGDAKESDKHANAAEFFCELITQGRSMRQTEQENDSFEPAFAGSNPLLQMIESEETITSLLNVILEPSVNEHAIISGILVVLTLVKPVVFADVAATDRARIMQEREKDNHDNIISTVIRVVGPRLKEFIEILRNPPVKPNMLINGAKILPPFGSTRLEICRLFTVLLQTGNEDITNAICETDYFNTILALFKDYCWNNFLHSEVEKSLHIVFSPSRSNNNSSINNNNNISTQTTKDGSFQNDDDQTMTDEINKSRVNTEEGDNNGGEAGDSKTTKDQKSPSALQTFVIVNSKIISKLIDCWLHNNEMQKAENGRRLGYMGHLMKIFKHITACISESDHIGALIESNLSDTELEQWQLLVKPDDGEFTMALAVQNRMLANCNAQESVDYSQHLPKEFLTDDFTTEVLNDFTATLNNLYINLDEDPMTEIFENQSSLHSFSHWDAGSSSGGGGGGGIDPLIDLSLIGQDESGDCNEQNSAPMGGWADFPTDNFADFDAHFSAFSNDMGESISEGNNKEILSFPMDDAPTTVPAAVNLSSFIPTSLLLTKSDFDNNANVEKTKSIDPFEEDDAEANFGSMENEQMNSNDFEDDAWTRTKDNESVTNATVLSNGPTAIQDTKDIEELSNQLKNSSITESSLISSTLTATETETTATENPALLSTFNEDKNDEQLKNASSENITLEKNPPSSTNESLCQENDTSTNIILDQESNTNSSPAATAAEEITPAL